MCPAARAQSTYMHSHASKRKQNQQSKIRNPMKFVNKFVVDGHSFHAVSHTNRVRPVVSVNCFFKTVMRAQLRVYGRLAETHETGWEIWKHYLRRIHVLDTLKLDFSPPTRGLKTFPTSK